MRWLGPKATYHGNIDKPQLTCTPNPQRNDSVPTLAQMTDKAIELLSKNEKGFFLQVEGASIDKQDHAANPCGESARRSISMKPYNGRWNSLKGWQHAGHSHR
ncbi:alkaline phosphatase [Escherichia coli]